MKEYEKQMEPQDYTRLTPLDSKHLTGQEYLTG